MKEELEKKLVEKYPNLYKDYGGDMTKTCMHWGFAHGDGWYNLIDELSTKLEPHGIVAAQVKEKFGGLRFYVEYPQHLSRELKSEFSQFFPSEFSSIIKYEGDPRQKTLKIKIQDLIHAIKILYL